MIRGSSGGGGVNNQSIDRLTKQNSRMDSLNDDGDLKKNEEENFFRFCVMVVYRWIIKISKKNFSKRKKKHHSDDGCRKKTKQNSSSN